MSKAAAIKTKYAKAQIQEALREDAHIYGLKYTEDMSEFGAYYPPERAHGNLGDPDYVPGVNPSFALIDPDINIQGLDTNDVGRTKHFGSPVTLNAKGLEIPWTIWANGIVVGDSVDDGETMQWMDHGNAGNDRIVFMGEKYVKNPETGEVTDDLTQAFKARGDSEADRVKNNLKRKDPDAEVLVGMLDAEGRLLTPIGAARIIEKMNAWRTATEGMADDGKSSLTNDNMSSDVTNYNVKAGDALINGITMNYFIGKKHKLSDQQKRDILKGKGAKLKGKMKVKKKVAQPIQERTFEENPSEQPVEELERVERYEV